MKVDISAQSHGQHGAVGVDDLTLRDFTSSGDFVRQERTGPLLAEGRVVWFDPFFPGMGV